MRKGHLYKSIWTVLCAVCLLVSMTSCNFFEVMEMPSGYVDSYPEEEAPTPVTPVEGGTLTVASTKYQTLNPLNNTNYYMEEILGLIYDGLISLNSSQQAVPVLAESLTPSADAREWTIKLRQNIVWHDGKYFSAEDVTHTIRTIQSNPEHKYAHCVSNIVSMEEPDAYTVVLKLQNPDSFLAEKMYFPVVPKHTTVDTTPVGTGLYKFVSVTDAQMELIAYGMNATTQGKKVPYIPTIQVKFYNDTAEVIYSDCDIVMVKSDDYQKVSGKIGYGTKKYVSTEYEVLAFNITKQVLSDSSVRRAIAYAMDRDGAVNTYSKVETIITDIPVVTEHWIRSSAQLTYGHDLDAAKKLLANSNYTQEQLTFTCLVNKDNGLRLQYAAYFKERLAEVGITLNITEVTTEEMTQKLAAKEYDLAFVGMHISGVDELTAFYGSTGAHNITGYQNTNLDDLFTKLSGYIYENERKEIFTEIEGVLRTDAPYVGLYYKQNFIFYNKSRVYGIGDVKPSYCKKFTDIETWFIVEDSANGTSEA